MLLALTMLATFILFPIISSGYAMIAAPVAATFIAGLVVGGKKDFVAQLASSFSQIILGYLFASKAALYFFAGPFSYDASEVVAILCLYVAPALVSALVGLELGRFVRAKLAARLAKGMAH